MPVGDGEVLEVLFLELGLEKVISLLVGLTCLPLERFAELSSVKHYFMHYFLELIPQEVFVPFGVVASIQSGKLVGVGGKIIPPSKQVVE